MSGKSGLTDRNVTKEMEKVESRKIGTNKLRTDISVLYFMSVPSYVIHIMNMHIQ